MSALPIIVGFGGINSSGRSSAHHGYCRTVFSALDESEQRRTLASLRQLMVPGEEDDTTMSDEQILAHTLVRRIEHQHFPVDAVSWNKKLPLTPQGDLQFTVSVRNMPAVLPPGWRVEPIDKKTVLVTVTAAVEMLVRDYRKVPVQAAGQLPMGFEPGKLYQSRNHPRGLQMTVFAASDALGSLGIDWSELQQQVPADQISVYAGSAMGQLDGNGYGGLLNSRALGKRVTSKQCALGFAEMPADFVNAYVLGSMGTTGTSMGACASFLYNLRHGIDDIRSGRTRIAVIGNSEAPINADIMEGYSAMGALATDEALLALDAAKALADPDYRRACRPFAENCGFTIAESAQFIILMDDALVMETGATIFAAAGDVFINADGNKKSISAPGVGNYITVAKAVASAKSVVGAESISQRSYVHAHGTSTPKNRTTESHILNETAKAFAIDRWPVAAVKCYLGHSIGCAAGDQIASALGVWQHGIIPGIATIESVADDVHQDHLNISPEHKSVGCQAMDVAFVNAKGFGGNNATGYLLAPHVVEKMLSKKYGAEAMTAYRAKNIAVAAKAAAYDEATLQGQTSPQYWFDHQVRGDEHISLSDTEIRIEGYDASISLEMTNPYAEMCD
ncbi:acetoacetyl-[acyl-carrier protein] synthase [Sinobacterium caligoides]|uniref:Acetoacetyl-[acyl-carrier protein] synthase n=1 Tax=Sinobacterium caligoides TaxID=933926 RepID=A0A3N2E0H1_9GAMM|nr:beta-ketoacyl synthase [Sinobacterium caligoides]ROS05065.1 acetoacetyl-[acyl-carrier protein] synthase [Sinobacterium caligoides]